MVFIHFCVVVVQFQRKPYNLTHLILNCQNFLVESGESNMKRTRTTIGSSLLIVLIVTLLVPSFPMASSNDSGSTAQAGIKTGDMVYVDNAKARISASPHTLTADGYVFLNVTSKSFGGDIDFCFGFADKQAFPTSLEVYDPQITIKQNQLDLSAFPSTAGYRVNYNFSKKTDNTFLKGYVSVEYDTNFLSASNQTARGKSDNLTLNSSWKTVLRQYIDVGYLDSQMLYWNTTETTYWRSLSTASSF
jgi:hypothetical protein